jgi:cyclophilin family peptidyl-prolyl cis-trans isomerase
MKKLALYAACVVAAAFPVLAQEEAKEVHPSPGEIVASAKAEEWVPIPPSDLMVMDLAKDRDGKSRRVVIQLMPTPFSQGWVGNIRKLVAARWYDGVSVNRVQDNYVVQWGDATEKKALPEGLAALDQTAYQIGLIELASLKPKIFEPWHRPSPSAKPLPAQPIQSINEAAEILDGRLDALGETLIAGRLGDGYTPFVGFSKGFAVGWIFGPKKDPPSAWPIHCYGMVGVGRNLSPDTGSGAELYTVIGHAPRHLDRNIALVGRVIEGIEHLSSLPRGTGALGFYEKEDERVPILSVRMGDETADIPTFEYLSTDGEAFVAYADARANRRDPFFNIPAGGADICNIPVPVRRKP